MSRSSLLTTFVLSHKCAQFELKTVSGQNLSVVVNQGKTAFETGHFEQADSLALSFEAIHSISVASEARAISSWLCVIATSTFLPSTPAFWQFPRVHGLRCREA